MMQYNAVHAVHYRFEKSYNHGTQAKAKAKHKQKDDPAKTTEFTTGFSNYENWH